MDTKRARKDALEQFNKINDEIGNAFSAIGSGLKFPAILAGVGELPAATLAITNVAGALQQLAGAGFAVPGIIGGIASSLVTAKIGVSGMADAFDALEKSGDGSAKSAEKANEALAKLAPSARDAVRAASDVKKELTDALQQPIQQNLFAGVSEDLRKLVASDLPVLQRGLGGISTALNQNLRQLMTSLGSERSQGLLDRILGNTADAQARFTKAIDPIVNAIGTLTAAGSDVLPRLADGLGAVGQRFERFITTADQDGRLDKWINEGIDGFGHLGETVLSIGKIIGSLTDAAGGDGGLLKLLDDGTSKLATFLNSAEGQNSLKQWFDEGRQQLGDLVDLAKEAGPVLKGVFEAGKDAAAVLVPLVTDVLDVINSIPGGAQTVVTAFLAWKGITAVGELATSLRSISTLLSTISGKSKTAGGAIGGAFKAAAAVAGAAAAAGGLSDINSNGAGLGNAATTVGGGALLGWSLAGVPGAAVGTAVGLGAGVVTDMKNRHDALDKINDPSTSTEERRKLSRQLFGDLSTSDAPKPGSFLYDTILADAKAGKIPEIDAGNAEQTMRQLYEQAERAKSNMQELGNLITTLPGGEVVLKEQTPQAIQRVEDLGFKIQKLPDGNVKVNVDDRDANDKMRAFIDRWSQAVVNPKIAAPGQGTPGSTGGPGGIFAPIPLPTGASGGPTPSGGRGNGPTGGYLAEVHANEWILPAHARAAIGDQALWAMTQGRSFAGGGFVDEFGNPVIAGPAPGPSPTDPIAPNPSQGGLAALAGGLLSGLGGVTGNLQGLMGGLGSLSGDGQGGGFPGLGGGAPGTTDTGAKLVPGLFGLLQAGDNPDLRNQWSQQTGDWLGTFAAKTALSFGTTLYKGALGLVGLENSVLSPDNSWFKAAAQSAGFFLGDDGPFATLNGGQASGSKSKGPTAKQVREAQQKSDRAQQRIDEINARIGELPADAKGSQRLSLKNDLANAQQDAADAKADLATLMGGASPGATAAIDFAQQQAVGQQYRYGGVGDGGYDCSGIASAIYAASKGLPQGTRYFTTESDFAALGFRQGYQPGALNIGVRRGGGGRNSHMAVTLPNGVNVESGGAGNTTRYGGDAAGATSFPMQWYLPLSEGQGAGAVPGFYAGGGAVPAALVPGSGGGRLGPLGPGEGSGRNPNPGRFPGSIGLPDWSVPGTRWGDPPSDWWLKPIDPDDVLFPDRWGQNPWGKHPLDKHRFRPLTAATGGGVPGSGTGDTVPAMLTPGEHVLTTADVAALGGQAGVYAMRSALHMAVGGEVPLGAVIRPRPPAPRPPQAQPTRPRPALPPPPASVAPAVPPREPVASAAPAPGVAPPAPPAAAAPSTQESAPPPPAPVGGPAPVASAPSSYDHNLPAVNTAIASTASTLGSIAQTAAAVGTFGAAGLAGGLGAGIGGGGGPSIQGLFQLGGKAVQGLVNVGSSLLVGNITPGTTDNAYGETLRPPQKEPMTAPLNGGGTVNNWNIQGVDHRTFFDEVRVKESQDLQARLARFGG